MSSQVLATIFHFVAFAYYCYVYAYYKMEVDLKLPHHNSFGGDLKFLTVWCTLFQILYFFVCCVTDLILTSGSRTRIGQTFLGLRDWFYCSVAFPITLLVGLMYWGIYAIDRELIYPVRIQDVYPMWLSHCMHTYIVFIMLLEAYLLKHKQPSRKSGMLGLLVVGLSYLLWMLYLGFVKGLWVYPFLRELEGIYFVIFVLVTASFLAALYFAAERCNLVFGKNKPDPDLMYSKID
nr:androgen-induced gene 1 protein-like [Lytechinus pictus]